MYKKMCFSVSMQKGQTMLIVILAIVIALTVGLSVVSRSITSTKTSTEEVNSQKALAAAEAGIEKVLQELTTSQDYSIDGSLENSSVYDTEVSSLEGDQILLAGGNRIEKDVGIDLWFVEHNDDGTPDYSSSWNGEVTIYWGEDTAVGNECNNAALEIVILSDSVNDPVLKRFALDACSNRASENQFDGLDAADEVQIQGGGEVSGKTFAHSASININNGFLAKIIPLYTSSEIAVTPNTGTLPSQGLIINSIGASGAQGSRTERKIIVFQGFPSLPVEYFPNNFFYYSNL